MDVKPQKRVRMLIFEVVGGAEQQPISRMSKGAHFQGWWWMVIMQKQSPTPKTSKSARFQGWWWVVVL
jgi:hypothetical protein